MQGLWRMKIDQGTIIDNNAKKERKKGKQN